MGKNECDTFMERFTGEKCEKFYYCLPDIDFPKGLRLIRNENNYSTFISIAYEYSVELPLYVEHIGTTNMQEWLDEEREEVVDTIHEEVVDMSRMMVKQMRQGIQMIMPTLIFFKKKIMTQIVR